MITPVDEPVRTHDLEALLEKIADHSRGEMTAAGIWKTLAAGEWWLLEVANGKAVVIVKSFTVETGLRVLELVGIAGDDLKDWIDAVKELERLAKSWGFDRLKGRGRRGWGPVVKKYGWKETGVILEKDLHDA